MLTPPVTSPHPKTVIAGLDPAIHACSCEVAVEIAPIGIARFDQCSLPGAWPFLEVFFSLNGGSDVVESLGIGENLDVIPLRESWNESSRCS